MKTQTGSNCQNVSYPRPGFSLESEVRTITNHCIQRLSERYLLDLTYQELNNIRKLIKTGYYILIRVEDNKVRLLTRYNGRYITFVMTNDFNRFITALPYNQNDLLYIEQFVKEFDT